MNEDQRLDKLTEMVDNMIFIGDSPKEIADMCMQMTKQWYLNDENKIKADAVREAKIFLFRSGFNYGAPYALDSLISQLDRG